MRLHEVVLLALNPPAEISQEHAPESERLRQRRFSLMVNVWATAAGFPDQRCPEPDICATICRVVGNTAATAYEPRVTRRFMSLPTVARC